MHWYLDVLRKYAEFTGRARRQEFWMFVLVNFIIMAALRMFGLDMIHTLYSLAVLVPSLAVGARRLHDTGRSGWWLLLNLIPVIGWIVLIVLFAQDSQPGDNEYGPSPKETSAFPASTAD